MLSKSSRNLTIISNFAIAFMLIGMLTLAFTYNTKYAFKEESDKPIYEGDRNSNNVTIMFNVYWGTEYLPQILDVLESYDAKTTFFVGGMWVEKNPDMLKEIHKRGHEIGNHGYFHKDHDKLDYNGNYNEIEPNNLIIERYIGVKPSLFAPPSGAFNKTTLEVARSLNMKTIMWTRDTIDWRDKDANIVYNRAIKDIKGGDLILAHPTKHTLEALPKILKCIRDKGLNVVTVSENIGLKRP